MFKYQGLVLKLSTLLKKPSPMRLCKKLVKGWSILRYTWSGLLNLL